MVDFTRDCFNAANDASCASASERFVRVWDSIFPEPAEVQNNYRSVIARLLDVLAEVAPQGLRTDSAYLGRSTDSPNVGCVRFDIYVPFPLQVVGIKEARVISDMTAAAMTLKALEKVDYVHTRIDVRLLPNDGTELPSVGLKRAMGVPVINPDHPYSRLIITVGRPRR